MAKISEKKIEAYALENAIKHDGKANQSAVLAGLFSEGLEKSEIKTIIPLIQKTLQKINSISIEKQQKEFEKIKNKISKREIRVGLPELENAKPGEVVMRFAPFPSGPIHLGNTRQLILNDEYVKKYNGKLILVMDDTIGSEKKPVLTEAYKLIEEGVKWLECNYDKKIIYKSDRIELYYKYAEELIKRGYLYICNCPIETIHKNKEEQKECNCRNLYTAEQEKRWKSMFTSKEGTYCARLKTSMQDPDPAFRDRIMFRISKRPHPRLKNKYQVYPLLDFSWAVDDHLLGITHIIRGMDLVMESKVEKFIWDIFNWPHPEIIHTGFFQIEGVKISKSKGAQEVKTGEYIGWNDPRLWSLQSLKDRGIQPQTIREFIISQGIKKSNTTVPIDILYSINKKLIENSPRYFFIKNPVQIKINGSPELTAKIPLHPTNKLGEKEHQTTQEFYITKDDYNNMQDNENYRLMHLLNFKIHKVSSITPKEFSYTSTEPDKNLKSKLIHWLPKTPSNVNITIIMPNGEKVQGIGEEHIKNIKEETIVQFERFGFAKLKAKEKNNLEFFFTHK